MDMTELTSKAVEYPFRINVPIKIPKKVIAVALLDLVVVRQIQYHVSPH